jgi:periplasmic divalent cation tolerance protein
MSAELWIVTTTFGSRDDACRVARLLVDGGLAVCAQVGANVTSYYRWQGEVQEDAEVGVVLKVLPERLDLCTGELKLQHPYDTPQITAWPLGRVDAAYLAWARGGKA